MAVAFPLAHAVDIPGALPLLYLSGSLAACVLCGEVVGIEAEVVVGEYLWVDLDRGGVDDDGPQSEAGRGGTEGSLTVVDEDHVFRE